MCAHCRNAEVGCIHCRETDRPLRRRWTDDERRALGLVAGRLFSPASLHRAAARKARETTAVRPAFGPSVLPAGFALA